VVAGASLAALNVEIALGTLRHHLLPMVCQPAQSYKGAAIGHMPMVRAEVPVEV
jgi:hypothetical protein